MTDQEVIEQYEAEEKLIDKDPKVLEFLTEDGGWTSEPILQDIVYDIEFGYKKKFYVRNPSKILTATLRDVEFSNPKWLFHAPRNNEIFPLETVAVMLEIPPDKKASEQFMDDILSGKTITDLEKERDKKIEFKGKIKWAVRPTILNFEKELRKKFEDGKL